MAEYVKEVLDQAEEEMKKALNHFEKELVKIRAGKANPMMLEVVKVDYYGTLTPLNQVGSVTAPDARQLVIQPWEKSMLQPIERAITNANLGLNPSNDGTLVRVPIPSLNEERRRELVKQAKAQAENSRQGLRGARQDANKALKELEKDGLSEDERKRAEDSVDNLTKEYDQKIEDHFKKKEAEIMTV